MKAVRGSLILLITLALFSCGKKESEEDLYKASMAFEEEENFEEAIYGYEKLAREYPSGGKADESLQRAAFLYYNNIHDFRKAIELQQRLIEKHPQSEFVSRARFMIGFIYANDLQDFDAAKTAYAEFLQQHPESELAESVKWELEHLGKDVDEQLLNLVGSDGADGGVESN